MPAEMLLRSGRDWHLDAAGEHTLDAYVEEHGLDPEAIDPIPIGVFIGYADWFAAQKGIEPRRERVRALVRRDDGLRGAHGGRLDASSRTASSPRRASRLRRRAARGARAGSRPSSGRTPPARSTFAGLRGRRCLILGGRQSAFEWAALLAEAGAARVDVVHRHDTPEFTASDWSFVDDLLARTRQTRGWFRGLPEAERAAIVQRFWQVGRLQLEPWLADRIARDTVHLWPRSEPARSTPGRGTRSPSRCATAPAWRPTTCCSPPATGSTCGACPTSPPTGSPTSSSSPTASPCSTRTSRPTSRASTSPASRRRATSVPFFGFVAGATTTAEIIGAALER